MEDWLSGKRAETPYIVYRRGQEGTQENEEGKTWGAMCKIGSFFFCLGKQKWNKGAGGRGAFFPIPPLPSPISCMYIRLCTRLRRQVTVEPADGDVM